MKKRLMSLFIVMCMVLCLAPLAAYAEGVSSDCVITAGEGGKVRISGTSNDWVKTIRISETNAKDYVKNIEYKADEGYELDNITATGAKIIAVAAGDHHTILLDSSGRVWTAGSNQYGQLGRSVSGSKVFTQVSLSENVEITAIAAGKSYSVLLDKNGNVWTAGNQYSGLNGIPDSKTKNTVFTKLTDVSNISAIAAGEYHTVLITTDGKVLTAGYNGFGQLGRTLNTGVEYDDNFTEATFSDGLSGAKIKSAAAGIAHTILVDDKGDVWAAGTNSYGGLGLGETTSVNTFTKVTIGNLGGVKITSAAAGTQFTILLDNTGNVWTAGANNNGQLGRDTTETDSNKTFKKVDLGSVTVTKIAAGGSHAILAAGTDVYTAGYNNYKQLGRTIQGQYDGTFAKADISSGTSGDISAVAGGLYNTIIVTSNGDVDGWGYNYYGELGRYTSDMGAAIGSTDPMVLTAEQVKSYPDPTGVTFTYNSKTVGKVDDEENDVVVFCGYPINLKAGDNGSLKSDNEYVIGGKSVTITPTSAKGYDLETLTVKDSKGNKVDVTANSDGTYTFTMPDSAATVYATFMEDNSILNYFIDVNSKEYYYDAVLWAAKKGITGGVDESHFAPDGLCTRAQAVTFLWRMAGSPEPTSTVSFKDVVPGSYYEKAVMWAVERGITKGTGDNTFSPDTYCTRGQIITFLYRAQETGMTGAWMFKNPFTDVDSDAYYFESVMWAVANNVTSGTSATTFSPDSCCTRAQIVTFMYNTAK